MASNVLGTKLEVCSNDPKTGFMRNGLCETCGEDTGMHTVCAEMTEPFLEFSRQQGNDLSHPAPDFGFPGLKPGDRWCVCVERWVDAYRAGVAPPVKLAATHISVLEFVDLEALQRHALPEETRP